MESKTPIGAFVGNIETETLDNTNFRTTLFTGSQTQLTVMSIEPGGEIGWEAHDDLEQFIRVEQGRARVELGSEEGNPSEQHEIGDDWVAIIPAGAWHNVVNIGDDALKLYSLYSPPEHPANTVHVTKADSDADEHHH